MRPSFLFWFYCWGKSRHRSTYCVEYQPVQCYVNMVHSTFMLIALFYEIYRGIMNAVRIFLYRRDIII